MVKFNIFNNNKLNLTILIIHNFFIRSYRHRNYNYRNNSNKNKSYKFFTYYYRYYYHKNKHKNKIILFNKQNFIKNVYLHFSCLEINKY